MIFDAEAETVARLIEDKMNCTLVRQEVSCPYSHKALRGLNLVSLVTISEKPINNDNQVKILASGYDLDYRKCIKVSIREGGYHVEGYQ